MRKGICSKKDAAELAEQELELRAIGRKCQRGNLSAYARTCERAADWLAVIPHLMRSRLGEPGENGDDGEEVE